MFWVPLSEMSVEAWKHVFSLAIVLEKLVFTYTDILSLRRTGTEFADSLSFLLVDQLLRQFETLSCSMIE
jgi:hypothetical protein